MLRYIVVPLVVSLGCGGADGLQEPVTVGALMQPDSLSVVGGDLYASYDIGATGLFRVSTADATTTDLFPGWRVGDPVSDGSAMFARTQVEPAAPTIGRLPLDGGALLELAPAAGTVVDVAVDEEHVYWSWYDDLDASRRSLSRVARTGGSPEVLLAEAQEVEQIVLGANDVYFIAQPDAWAIPKTGGAPRRIAEEVTSHISREMVLVGETLVAIVNSGGGVQSTFLRVIPIAGGAWQKLYTQGCDHHKGVAPVGPDVYATCVDADAAVRVLRIPVDGTTAEVLTQIPPVPGVQYPRVSQPAVDAEHVYFVVEDELLQIDR